MIEFKNISVTYPGGVKALNNVSLDITEGDFVIIKNEKDLELLISKKCKFFEIVSPIIPPYKTYAEIHNIN